MSKKTIVLLVVGLFFAVTLGAGVFFSLKGVQPQSAVPQETVPVETAEKIDMDSWSEYQNEKFNFKLKLPADWTVLEEGHKYQNGGESFSFGNKECLGKENLIQSCNKLVKIEVYENALDDQTIMAWQASDFEYIDGIDDLDLPSAEFPEVASFRAFAWEQSWDVYQFLQGSAGYKLALKNNSVDSEPLLERAILESFRMRQ